LDLIIYLDFSTQFGDRKKFEKNIFMSLVIVWIFSVYLVLILGVLFSVLILLLELACLGVG